MLFQAIHSNLFYSKLWNYCEKAYVIITENRVQYETKITEMERQITGIHKMIANFVEENQLLYLI
jgi:regulator of replication initiation timing